MKLSEIALELDLKVYRDAAILSLGKVNHAKEKLLVFLESIEYLHLIEANSNTAGVVTTEKLARELPSSLGAVVSSSPRVAFYTIHEYLIKNTDFYGELNPTIVDSSAQVNKSAIIASRGVKIGANVIVEAGSIIHERVVIEANVIVRSGAVIGAEGFEFFKNGDSIKVIPHSGGVLLQKNSEIQSGTVIEKAIYGGETIVGEGSKLGSNSLLAHNSVVSKCCLIAGGVTISGNVEIKEGVWIGPGATISNGIIIGANSNIALGSTVARNVAEKASISGVFATDKHDMFKFMAKSKLIK